MWENICFESIFILYTYIEVNIVLWNQQMYLNKRLRSDENFNWINFNPHALLFREMHWHKIDDLLIPYKSYQFPQLINECGHYILKVKKCIFSDKIHPEVWCIQKLEFPCFKIHLYISETVSKIWRSNEIKLTDRAKYSKSIGSLFMVRIFFFSLVEFKLFQLCMQWFD